MRLKALFILFVLFVQLSYADVKLPKIFSSNMVLQQGIEIPVWGWASPGEKVTVSLSSNTAAKVKTDKEGKWKVKLDAQKYGGPFILKVEGENSIELKNVMIGEVWICSGQSNMQMSVKRCNNSEKEIADANYPNIRLFSVPKEFAQSPQEDITSGEWVECSPESIPGFSGVAYFFGRNLHNKLNVPIGLIHTSWGGTVAETWTSAKTIKDDPDFSERLKEFENADISNYKVLKAEKIKSILGGEYPTKDSGLIDSVAIWATLNFNDKTWKYISSDKRWEAQGYKDINGIGWYRKEFELTEKQSKNEAIIHLGKIEDKNIAWVNGYKVGETNQNINRVYHIDQKYLKAGKNVVAVRVENNWGNGGFVGDIIEQYLSVGNERINLNGDWKFKISEVAPSSLDLSPNSYPTMLYNSMINPLIPYAIKGAIWYQGESNAGRAKQYQRIFQNMIKDWRKHWQQGDFPFLFVSLANYNDPKEQPDESSWAELREAQTLALKLPNTGMALAIDIGEAKDIHPRNKQEVGRRLSLAAQKVAYNTDIVYSGPMYHSVEFNGQKAVITFNEVGSGLLVKNKYGYVNGFAIAGADKKFCWAQAEIISKNQVSVWSDDVKYPVAIRYGWADNPDDLNLYNKEGLPANPFRTDDWLGITK